MTQPAQYISGRTVQEQMNELISYVDTRAAEVATDAIASDVAQVHQDMLDADADAQAAAASAAAAAGTLANAVKKTGEASQSIAGDIAVAGDLSAGGDAGVQGQLSVLGGCDLRAPVKIPVTPTNNDDAASKKYVDDSLAGYVPMVRTTGNQGPITGNKNFSRIIVGTSGSANLYPLDIKNDIFPSPTSNPPQNSNTLINFTCYDGNRVGSLRFRCSTTGERQLWLDLIAIDGTVKPILIAEVNASGVVTRGWD